MNLLDNADSAASVRHHGDRSSQDGHPHSPSRYWQDSEKQRDIFGVSLSYTKTMLVQFRTHFTEVGLHTLGHF